MKVSVVVPVFNNEATVGPALQSVFAQRFDGLFEVIVVNDGSTDGTRNVLEKFGDQIRVIDQQRRGVSAARNAAIGAAAGEYIALLDGDDLWEPDRLRKSVQALDENPACAAAYSDGMLMDAAGSVVVPGFVPPECQHSPTLDEMLGRIWPMMVSSTTFRREAILAIQGFSEEFAVGDYFGEDVLAFVLVRERGEIVYVPETLVRYRMSEFRQRLTKWLHPLEVEGKPSFARTDPDRYFAGNRIFARLVLERFGARGRPLAAIAIDRAASEQVSLGMLAMHEGDRAYARLCYLRSIRNRPLMLKTYLRLAWALLPTSVTRTLAPMFSPGLRRSLSGPPLLEERPQ
ncbi:MAG TPA: glycosyltransferase [Candidatus Binatus sp.]|nr:glycosyltransferase [Candidatus Binatus sp.]